MTQPITGYRALSEEELKLINHLTELAVIVGDAVADLRRGATDFDQRWVSIGATHLQEGFMALTRSVAQPTTF